MKIRKPWFCQDCRVSMTYDAKQDYYKCPECGTEVWPENTDSKGEIESLMRDMAATHSKREAMPAGEALPGGGSKSKGRKTERMKKPTLATLNQRLYGQV